MKKMIFVNLPVESLERSERFYKAIGFTKQEEYSNDVGIGMAWSDEIWVMLLKYDFYKKFINGRIIPDAHQVAQVLLALSIDSREELDQIVAKAKDHGAKVFPQVIIEGAESMYSVDFADPDGHIWELVNMQM